MAWFSFTDASGEIFAFRLSRPELVAEARNILAGAQTDAIHVAGQVVKSSLPGNVGWSFHIAPESVFFFEISAEVGDSTMRLIENDLASVGGGFLPGSMWTGWSSRLLSELNVIRGTPDADSTAGSDGNDLVFCGAGDDLASGGRGQDHITGHTGDDVLDGGAGRDKLDGGGGNDLLDGGAGNDVLVAGLGSDELTGGTGTDFLIITARVPGSDTMIADFESGELLQLHRSWLDRVGDINEDGTLNRRDLVDAFATEGADLVCDTGDGAVITLRNAAALGLSPGDFWLVG